MKNEKILLGIIMLAVLVLSLNAVSAQQLIPSPCAGVDICDWELDTGYPDNGLPMGSDNCCGCDDLFYNTQWDIGSEQNPSVATATCTFDGDLFTELMFYVSINNDIVECTLNGETVFSSYEHEGCAEADPRDGQSSDLWSGFSQYLNDGTNTIVCEVQDRGSMSHFDACVVGDEVECLDDNDCAADNNYCDDGSTWVHESESCVEGECVAASSTGSCDDGNFCNGVETCEGAGECVSPTDNICDDGDSCTDECNEGTNSCTYDIDDNEGPVTSSTAVEPEYNNGLFNITSEADDACSIITEAEYFLGSPGTPGCDDPGDGDGYLAAYDGDFDELVESLIEDDGEWFNDGNNWVCVRSKDSKDNWGNCECTYFESDTIPPELVSNIKINGVSNPNELLVCDGEVNVSATFCDTQSRIQGGEFFLNMLIPPNPIPAPWTGQWLEPINQYFNEQSWRCADTEGQVSQSYFDSLADGTHYLSHIRGKDIVENWGKIYGQNFNYSFIKDTTEPIVEKEIFFRDDIHYTCDDTEANGNTLTDGCYYVKNETLIHLTAYDFNPDDSTNNGFNDLPGEYAGDVVIHYNLWWSLNGDQWEVIETGSSETDGDVWINLSEDSYHLIEFWAVDGCGYESQKYYELDIVDTKAPESEKELVGDQVACSADDISMYTYNDCAYVDQDTVVELSCKDVMPHPVGDVDIHYQILWRENWEDDWVEGDVNVYNGNETSFTYDNDSFHLLAWWCQDGFRNIEEKHYELDIVDTKEPTLTKEVGEEKVPYCGAPRQYVSKMLVPDNGNFPTGTANPSWDCQEEKYKWNIGLSDDYTHTEFQLVLSDGAEENPLFLVGWDNGATLGIKYYDGGWGTLETLPSDIEVQGVPGDEHFVVMIPPSYFAETPYWAVNVGATNSGSTKFAKYPHNWDKWSGTGVFAKGFVIHDWYVTQDTPITLNCVDEGPHPVDNVTIHWQWGPWGDFAGNQITTSDVFSYNGETVTFNFTEDSWHRLDYWCVDALGNTVNKIEYDVVDTQAPESSHDITGPEYYNESNDLFIDNASRVVLSCMDNDPHPVGEDYIMYRYYNDGELVQNWTEYMNGSTGIRFPEESHHELEYYCVDLLGNNETVNSAEFYVDHSKPYTELSFGTPYVENGTSEWITQNTEITLTASDDYGFDHDSGVANTYVRWDVVDDSNCNTECEASADMNWKDYYGPFKVGEDSCHVIEYYSVDNVDKTEDIKKKCVFVDTQEPDIWKVVGEPNVPAGFYSDEEGTSVVDAVTPSTNEENRNKGWAHVNVAGGMDFEFVSERAFASCFEYRTDGDTSQASGNNYNGDISDGLYPFFCVNDNTRVETINAEEYVEIRMVFGAETDERFSWTRFNVTQRDYFVRTDTPITLYCEDTDPHPVNNVTMHYYWDLIGEDTSDVVSVNAGEHTFMYPTDSEHHLYFWCEDELGNTAGDDKNVYEIDYVDTQAPETTKTVSDDAIACSEVGQDDCHYWVTNETTFSLSCSDTEPHPVGDDYMQYRYFNDDVMVQDWTNYSEPFSLTDGDSEHLVQYRCVDKLGNWEAIQNETDHVDTASPNITKFVRVIDSEIDRNETYYEGDVGVRSGAEVKFCAEVIDLKRTDDAGVGVDEVWGRIAPIPEQETQMTLDPSEGENVYCFTKTIPEDTCGEWHYEVMADDLLGNIAEWENGINIIIDNVGPIGEVLNPHAGQYYRDGKPFWVYAPVIDFAGEGDCFFGDCECEAIGVDYCEFYAIDYDFEGINQSEISCIQDYIPELLGMGKTVVPLGRTEAVVEGNEVICQGQVEIPEDSGLSETAFLAWDIVDKAGNRNGWLALNPWASPITMNMDNEGPGVTIIEDGIIGPITAGDNVRTLAEIVEYKSGFDECWADIHTSDEGQLGEDTGMDISGVALEYNLCEISGPLPEGLDSGNYYLEVQARDEQFNIGSAIAMLKVDNTRPVISIGSPHEGDVFGEMFPVSLKVVDEMSDVANETVMFRLQEIPNLGNAYCIFGTCEDSGWVSLEGQSENIYAGTINLTEYEISGNNIYVFNAVACDVLYVPEEDTEMGFSMGNSRTDMHCRMLSEHGNADEIDLPECGDGFDNDGDGNIDFDADPGCYSSDDESEEATCGNGYVEAGEECDGGEDCNEQCEIVEDNIGNCVDEPEVEWAILHNGSYWAWASPCDGGCSDIEPIALPGWRYATAEEWDNRPAVEDFGTSGDFKCAASVFDPVHNHCDYWDADNGYLTSEPTNSHYETWLVYDCSEELVEDA